MFQPSFILLRAFGFLPCTASHSSITKRYSLSKNWHAWSQLLHGAFVLFTIWRIYYYVLVSSDDFYKKMSVYRLIVMNEPFLNLLYILMIKYPIYCKSKLKQIEKCMNLLDDIKLKESSWMQKSIFYVAFFGIVTLVGTVELIMKPVWGLNTFQDELDYIITLFTSITQNLHLVYNCTVYCVVLDRLKLIEIELEKITTIKLEKQQFKSCIASYSQCTKLIDTFNNLHYFILRNIWLHCVYDVLGSYLGCQLVVKAFMNGEKTEKDLRVDFVAVFWNIYNLPLAFLLFILGGGIQDKVGPS